MEKAGNWQWIFALSIDDEVTWSLTRVNCEPNINAKSAYWDRPHFKTLVELRENDSPQLVIRKRLMELKNSEPWLRDAFDNTVAVGISTLGVVDRGEPRALRTSEPRLLRIARKSWQKTSSRRGKCVLNFRPLLNMFGDNNLKIAAENDATAYAIAEYEHKTLKDKILYYVLLSDGVNAGLLINGLPPELPVHPEVGHIIPARYEYDRDFVEERHSGCPAHGVCFEGLASGARIIKQWKKPLQLLRDDSLPGSPLDIISAYAAALAWAGACATAPDKFIIGGHVMIDELIPLIRDKFDKLNDEYLPDYPKGKTGRASRIQPAGLRHHQGILGGLEIARRAATPRRLKVRV